MPRQARLDAPGTLHHAWNQLVAPDWSLDKRRTIAMIQDRIKEC